MLRQWSTRHIAPDKRTQFWREATRQAIVPMTPRLDAVADFQASLVQRTADVLALNDIRAPGHGVQRTAQDLAQGGQQLLFVNFYAAGSARVSQQRRSADAAAGGWLVFDSSREFVLEHPRPIRLLSLSLPRLLLPRALERTTLPLALPDSCAVAVLGAQLRAFADWPHELPAHQATALCDSVAGMVAAALRPADDDAGERPRRVQRAALRRLLESRYAERGLTAARAAQLLGVSPRSVHAWLAAEGRTFAGCLLELRLQRARALLASAGASAPPVADVAERCGFATAAHFARRFRQRFGLPPSAARSV